MKVQSASSAPGGGIKDRYETVIGLEVHAQLKTASKIFCGCSTTFGARPNTQVCEVCLGLPGVLPVLNERAVRFAVMTGIAVGASISERSVFARKNYFYPDLPKGYQISQYDRPLCVGGGVDVRTDGVWKRIGLVRIHLEEDAGKSLHPEGREGVTTTRVDLNRTGVPLIEIVSEPEIRSGAEAYDYLMRLKQILVYLDVCDGNMEEGSLRCDANVSVRPKGQAAFGTKAEIKNMNSFRNVERAIAFETDRQIGIVESGGRVVQETLLWNADKGTAEPMRSKEEAHDYRYFPEPDLPPLDLTPAWIESIRSQLPELPHQVRERLTSEFGIPEYDAEVLTETRALASYYEDVARRSGNPKLASNWIMTEVNGIRNKQGQSIEEFPIRSDRLGDLVRLIATERISGKIGKQIFEMMLTRPEGPEELVKTQGLAPIDDEDALSTLAREVIAANPGPAAEVRAGKERTFAFLVGQAMKQSRGRAHPEKLQAALRKELGLA
ncbi:MAG TPA: Asp-tRNA(Asn)/Glu-tRNA(Gln) amidotransferase subunit GatB [Candidatus Limnocylindrales bacterium]|jgi:aspartyl-tRNA(Asn)/glutamyl-tRNA(Gln) amidotransferase subunit B|nr:Asp-tRNA(Asn)/Glu-tRNA(Gln) amidotransferase subunit GatB [Candidatus Limnocylindrales bacterium]